MVRLEVQVLKPGAMLSLTRVGAGCGTLVAYFACALRLVLRLTFNLSLSHLNFPAIQH